jgi:hypothetical protein
MTSDAAEIVPVTKGGAITAQAGGPKEEYKRRYEEAKKRELLSFVSCPWSVVCGSWLIADDQ